MKKIYLMRHSKAGQTDKHLLNDHERPLTEKGEQLVPAIAEYFNANYKDNPPELILSSTALRAKQTATLFKKNYRVMDAEIRTFPELYITGSDEILSVIHKINEKLNSVLIISHNPGLQAFALKFSKAGDKQKYREMKANFAPGSFAAFDVDVKNWHDVLADSGTLLDFVSSKKLKD
jgi:phosphohistidine phosphatase